MFHEGITRAVGDPVSIATLKEELEREDALLALAGMNRTGGSTDLIQWSGPGPGYADAPGRVPEWKLDIILRHLSHGSTMRVSRGLIPAWLLDYFPDPTQLDGRCSFDAERNSNRTASCVYLRLSALGLRKTWGADGPAFVVGSAFDFMRHVRAGEIVDSE